MTLFLQQISKTIGKPNSVINSRCPVGVVKVARITTEKNVNSEK